MKKLTTSEEIAALIESNSNGIKSELDFIIASLKEIDAASKKTFQVEIVLEFNWEERDWGYVSEPLDPWGKEKLSFQNEMHEKVTKWIALCDNCANKHNINKEDFTDYIFQNLQNL